MKQYLIIILMLLSASVYSQDPDILKVGVPGLSSRISFRNGPIGNGTTYRTDIETLLALKIETDPLYTANGVPKARTITINGVAQDLSANRAFTISETDPLYTANGVPKARTITINGVAQDLSANRSFTISETDPLYTANGVPKTRTITINGTTLDLSANASFTVSTGIGTELDPVYTANGVPKARTLTINGTTLDLSANRTFTISETDPLYTANGVPKARTITINGTTLDLSANASFTVSETDPLYTANGVPKARTITINGTTLDLSANRTFTISETDPLYTANGVPKTRTITINGVSQDLATNASFTVSTGVGTEADPLYTANGVPKARTITINGTTLDLSANRTFTISETDATALAKTISVNGSTPQALTGNPSITLPNGSVTGAMLATSYQPLITTGVNGKLALFTGASTFTPSSFDANDVFRGFTNVGTIANNTGATWDDGLITLQPADSLRPGLEYPGNQNYGAGRKIFQSIRVGSGVMSSNSSHTMVFLPDHGAGSFDMQTNGFFVANALSASILIQSSGYIQASTYLKSGSLVGTGTTPVATLDNGELVKAKGGVVTWTTAVSGGPFATYSGSGYTANNGSQVLYNLPVASAVNDVIKISGQNAGGWRLQQGTGQSIRNGSSVSTSGSSGYIESSTGYESVELRCVTANAGWTVISANGTIIIN
jgi:hypothetical protein